ncbi:MAG: protein kinase [Chloroflexi bacterium]|nr:protein kinase [Chloroflexota bacterium]
MVLEIGQKLGPYTIEQQLGKGGMATVYKARHENLDRDVAIKVLHVAFKEDETFRERFRREAQIVARLDHPNIVSVYDFSEIEEQPYLVMKLVEGRTLKTRMRQAPPVSLEETLRILSAVASALDFAHDLGVLHRDVKPSNIMIDEENRPYLTDFGLARIASLGESTLSRDMMLGTPQYISPEQASGSRELDARTDIYSLGIVLYELVVGRVPYTGDTPHAIIYNHIYTPLPPPSEVNPTVPRSVQVVLMRALAKNPDDRYPTAGAMMRDFREAVERENMKELSAASYRPEAFADHAKSVMQSAPQTASSFGTPQPFPTAAIPAPGGTQWIQQSVSQSTQRPHNRFFGFNIWAAGGCLVFICTCIMSAATFFNAASIADSEANEPPIYASDIDLPEYDLPDDDTVAARDLPAPGRLRELVASGVSVDIAQRYINNNPDEPLGYFLLTLAQLESDQPQEAMRTLTSTLQEYEPDPQLIIQMAQILAERGRDEVAVRLVVNVLNEYPDDEELRAVGGEYLYALATEQDRNIMSMLCTIATDSTDSDLLLAVLGQSILTNTRRVDMFVLPVTCRGDIRDMSLDEMIFLDAEDTIAELDLIHANYYVKVGDTETAVQELNGILEEAETDFVPDWVIEVTEAKLETLES